MTRWTDQQLAHNLTQSERPEPPEGLLEKLKAEKTVEVPVAGRSVMTDPAQPTVLQDITASSHLLHQALAAAKKKDDEAGMAVLGRAARTLEQTMAGLPRMDRIVVAPR